MKGNIIFAVLLLLATARFNIKFPDALRCGDSAMYFPHAMSDSGVHYCQVYAAENRCVDFNSNGDFVSGTGH